MSITAEKDMIPWPKLEPKIQAVRGVINLQLRIGVAPGINILETSVNLPIDRIDPDRANEFLEALKKVVEEFGDPIPF